LSGEGKDEDEEGSTTDAISAEPESFVRSLSPKEDGRDERKDGEGDAKSGERGGASKAKSRTPKRQNPQRGVVR
jgi:hypothetical protein